MSTYGFHAQNTSGQVLISSNLQNFHFHSVITYSSILGDHDTYGGMVNYRFQITLDSTKPPLVFLNPQCNSIQAVIGVDILTTTASGDSVWGIDVAVAGTSSPAAPKLYIFTEPGAVPTPVSDSYGLTVYTPDGVTATFDSRKSPLLINGGSSITPPTSIIASTNALSPVETHWVEHSLNGLSATDIMFCAPSLAQAEREYTTSQHNEDCTGLDVCGACIGWEEVWDRSDTWWAFYRNGFQIKDNKFKSGWLTYNVGHHYHESESDRFIGIKYDGGSGSGGQQAINNGQINMNSNAYLFSKPSLYT